MRIVLTGATGLLGRNLLFEVLKQNLDKLDDLEILVLGRPQKSAPLDERLDNILVNDGYDYIGITPQSPSDLKEKISKCVVPIAFDLTHDDLGISQEDLNKLKRKRIDHFFHIAALTDFRPGKAVQVKLEEVNVKGTQRVLELVKKLGVQQLDYIGSAYSCGSKTGVVEPDYINLNEKFRNPYEKTKLEAEILVREFAKSNKMKFKIFRPSTICGRLIEKPIGSTPKFDVFYGWAAFFLREKKKHLKSSQNIFNEQLQLGMRIRVNSEAGLNVVPVDYAAKMLYVACVEDGTFVSHHLANSEETPHCDYIKWMFECINVTGYSFVKEEPQDKSELEKLYYRTVGGIFTPYIIGDSMLFRVDSLKNAHEKSSIRCPSIDKKGFMDLMNFAKQKNFGIR